MSAVDWSKPIEIVDGDRLIPATLLHSAGRSAVCHHISAGNSAWWASEDGTIPATDLIVRNVVEPSSLIASPDIADAVAYGLSVTKGGERIALDDFNADQPVTARVTLDYFSMIRGWAHDRNLIAGSTQDKQMLKLVEEFGEFGGALARGKDDEANDAIGDMIVVLTILAAQRGVEIEDCIAAAWNEIKDRKGRMVDGVFVKEGDQTA